MVKFPLGEPIDVNRRTWLYEDYRGLQVVRECVNKDDVLSRDTPTQVFFLPWNKVLKLALRWKRHKKSKK